MIFPLNVKKITPNKVQIINKIFVTLMEDLMWNGYYMNYSVGN